MDILLFCTLYKWQCLFGELPSLFSHFREEIAPPKWSALTVGMLLAQEQSSALTGI